MENTVAVHSGARTDPGGADAAERFDTIVIGGGQAGLATGYHLRKAGQRFVILDDKQRTGDGWRQRWDSLRLFTPAAFSSLVGMPFPASGDHFPTKDEFADYLEEYARRFELPVRHDSRVQRLAKEDGEFLATTEHGEFRAPNVIVAMANYQRPKIPGFAQELDPGIVQLHSSEYKSPAQLPADVPVLVVGAGNSGAEIALELSRRQPVMLAGKYPGHLPFKVDSPAAHAFLTRFVLKVIFHRVLTVSTPMGRKARPKMTKGSGPLIRTKAKHLAAAGVTRLPRVEGAKDGMPMLEDGHTVDVGAVVWSSGFRPGFEWIDLPLQMDAKGPVHDRGLVADVPGLYFVGLHFLYSFSSAMIHGVSRDAGRIVRHLVRRGDEPARRSVDPQRNDLGDMVEVGV